MRGDTFHFVYILHSCPPYLSIIIRVHRLFVEVVISFFLTASYEYMAPLKAHGSLSWESLAWFRV